MIRDKAFVLTSGRLVLGPKAERQFGRRNFMQLYAVFSSPQTYAVSTSAGHPVGSLNQDFVDRLVDGISCFLLGGRAWLVLRVQHDDRRVVIQPAPRGRKPTWGGFLPQFLGQELSQKILGIVTSDESYRYLDDSAATILQEFRESMTGILEPERGGIEIDFDEIRWWTFAGGRINATLRYALEAVGGDWKVIPDNFLIKVRGDHLQEHHFREALERISDLDFWEKRQALVRRR